MTGPLPDNVLKRLSKSNFLHLATCSDNVPHVSLMNYTFVSSDDVFKQEEQTPAHLIVIATCKNTQKYTDLAANPKCSILVHDWTTKGTAAAGNDNILNLLQSLNQAEISELSCTLSGHVYKFLDKDDGKEFEYYKAKHLARNPEGSVFVQGGNIGVVLIQIDTSKVVDASNHISRYT